MARTRHFFIQTFRSPAFDSSFEMAWADEPQWQPRVDIYQTESEILMHVEAAGVAENSLSLRLQNGQLVVEGERERPPLPCPQHCVQVEISYGAFKRVLPLPPDADGENIRANYNAGILQIHVPRKIQTPQNIRVEIR